MSQMTSDLGGGVKIGKGEGGTRISEEEKREWGKNVFEKFFVKMESEKFRQGEMGPAMGLALGGGVHV